ncbi:MAG TPA: hypothetical protein PKN39_02495 [Oscillospiraceae bacterium]|nr:hypothetical protein [Oscillospiraceae bacterium]
MSANADGSVTVSEPIITAATLAPNPASINGSVTVSITVTDSTRTIYPYKLCGASRCGGPI